MHGLQTGWEPRWRLWASGPILEDGTRRYYLSAEDADVHAFDPMLDKIDSNWRDHIENWRGERRSYPPGD